MLDLVKRDSKNRIRRYKIFLLLGKTIHFALIVAQESRKMGIFCLIRLTSLSWFNTNCHLCCNYNNQYMKRWYGQFAFSPLVQPSGIMKLTSTRFTCQRLVTCVLITSVMELKNRHLSQLDLRLKQMVVDGFWKSAKHYYRGRVWSSPRQARILWFYDCDKFLVIWGL